MAEADAIVPLDELDGVARPAAAGGHAAEEAFVWGDDEVRRKVKPNGMEPYVKSIAFDEIKACGELTATYRLTDSLRKAGQAAGLLSTVAHHVELMKRLGQLSDGKLSSLGSCDIAYD